MDLRRAVGRSLVGAINDRSRNNRPTAKYAVSTIYVYEVSSVSDLKAQHGGRVLKQIYSTISHLALWLFDGQSVPTTKAAVSG